MSAAAVARAPSRREVLVPVSVFDESFREHLRVVEQLLEQREAILQIGHAMLQCIASGGKLLWCGNGGSAADSQHLAAEFIGRFQRERQGLAAIALTTDTSVLTSVANDYGFEAVFARQVEALCRPGDVLVAISTSGNSRNVCAAVTKANQIGAHTVALTGSSGGKLLRLADLIVQVDCACPARVQEAHILVGHLLCEYVESHWISRGQP